MFPIETKIYPNNVMCTYKTFYYKWFLSTNKMIQTNGAPISYMGYPLYYIQYTPIAYVS